jgi:hypothetical protein
LTGKRNGNNSTFFDPQVQLKEGRLIQCFPSPIILMKHSVIDLFICLKLHFAILAHSQEEKIFGGIHMED